MRITTEFETNPGPNAMLVVGINFTKREDVYMDPYWWGVYFHFWLFRRKLWREWFFDYENSDEGSWKTFKIMILGFEFLWERLDREKGGTW